jgi:hypothetical protein
MGPRRAGVGGTAALGVMLLAALPTSIERFTTPASAAPAPFGPPDRPPTATPLRGVECFRRHVAFLADPALGGRGPGSPGLEAAGEYIAKEYARIGLVPVDGSYFQGFPGPPIRTLGSGSQLLLDGVALPPDKWAPLAMSPAGDFSGRGYWIPDDDIHDSPWEARDGAKDGASVVIRTNAAAPLTRPDGSLNGPPWAAPASLPVLQVVGPRAAERVELRLRIDERPWTARNVVALIPGRGKLASEAVVLGAHYDHLATRPDGSVFPGADDDASGIAGLLCAAEDLVHDAGDRRTIVVAAFTLEELGMLGSAWYVRHPVVPIAQTVAMLDLDMIGHLGTAGVSVVASDSAPDWAPLLRHAGRVVHDVGMPTGEGGFSDYTSFLDANVPAIQFFTGLTETYHTPADTLDTLDLRGGSKTTAFFAEIAREVAVAPRPRITRGCQGVSLRGGFRVGPEAMTSRADGVVLTCIERDGPLHRLHPGDRVVAVDREPVSDLIDLYALFKPGPYPHRVQAVRGGRQIQIYALVPE